MRTPLEILSYRFKYDGHWRHVDNVTFEGEWDTLVGFETRKDGKFSWKIKRFAMEKIQSPLEKIPPQMNQKHYDRIGE
jgi:hypothetical protein